MTVKEDGFNNMNRITAVLFIGILFGSCKNAEPTTYYIPKDYEGVFAVVYDQSVGTLPQYDPIGRRIFIIPENGILITTAKFSDGWRDDNFLQNTEDGYKTLKMYLPNKDTTGNKFDRTYYEIYSNDPDKTLINVRQIVEPTFNVFDSSGKKIRSCTFQYELITVGRASVLNDSVGILFKERLDNYLRVDLCHDHK